MKQTRVTKVRHIFFEVAFMPHNRYMVGPNQSEFVGLLGLCGFMRNEKEREEIKGELF